MRMLPMNFVGVPMMSKTIQHDLHYLGLSSRQVRNPPRINFDMWAYDGCHFTSPDRDWAHFILPESGPPCLNCLIRQRPGLKNSIPARGHPDPWRRPGLLRIPHRHDAGRPWPDRWLGLAPSGARLLG